MKKFLGQYRNLVISVAVAVGAGAFLVLSLCNSSGYFVKQAQKKAEIRNQMAIEAALAEQEIAIIQAETEAKLKLIAEGQDIDEVEVPALTEE